MRNQPRIYELSFVSPKRMEGRTFPNPQIVFTIHPSYVEELNRRLSQLNRRMSDEHFFLIEEDLFGRREFGYKKCGVYTQEEGIVQLRIELLPGTMLHYVASTVQVLAFALSLPMEEEKHRSNELQDIELQLSCDDTASVYGYAMTGFVSGQLTSWLRLMYEQHAEEGGRVSVPQEVVRAMKKAWTTLSSTESEKKFAGACGGLIWEDGRFMLTCHGNACDIAIYPDCVHEMEMKDGARFSCHNLDTAKQQMTLVAGLAKMCELARDARI